MKKLLTIAMLLFSIASYAQGNLQFNQVLTFTGIIPYPYPNNNTPVLYTVPSGKVCKIETTGICGQLTNVYLNINGIDYSNQATMYVSGTATQIVTKQETIWLKAGDVIKYINNSGFSKNYFISMIEYNIVQ